MKNFTEREEENRKDIHVDAEIEQTIKEFNVFRNKIIPILEPYQRPIIIISIVLLFIIVGFVGFVMGAKHMCNQVAGFFQQSFDGNTSCYLDYFPNGMPKNYTKKILEPKDVTIYKLS